MIQLKAMTRNLIIIGRKSLENITSILLRTVEEQCRNAKAIGIRMHPRLQSSIHVGIE